MTEREFVAADTELENVMAFTENELDAAECPMKIKMSLLVAIEELFVNVAHYAYPESEGKMRLMIDAQPSGVVFRFTDSGIPFNPLDKPDPDTTLPAEKRKIGGLGIYLAKKASDNMQYEYRNGQNILTLSKSF